MAKKQLFEYRVIGHANNGSAKNPNWKSEVIAEGEILAIDAKEAEFYIHREVDEDDVKSFGLENIEILIRPFLNVNRQGWISTSNNYNSIGITTTTGATGISMGSNTNGISFSGTTY